MRKMFFIFLITPFSGKSQPSSITPLNIVTGIRFEQGLNWDQVKAKAKAENKFIFMDCYATWCGPCKFMSQNIFNQKPVGDFFNERFINVSIQMDQTKEDSGEIKEWYKVATMVTKIYGVKSYPTFLFFSPDGNIVHRVVGTTGKEPRNFIEVGKEALNPNEQYYTVIDHYKDHREDSAFLRNAIVVALKESDLVTASTICNLYLRLLKDPFEVENLSLIEHSMNSTNDSAFKIYLYNANRIDEVRGKNWAEQKLRNIVKNEEVRPFMTDGALTPNWKTVYRNIKSKYSSQADRILCEAKVDYFSYKGNWTAYGQAILYFMRHYGSELGSYQLNDAAWTVFSNCTKKGVISEALKWSKRSLDLDTAEKYIPKSNYVNYVDTYANLLYKNGDKKSALIWEDAALKIAQHAGQKGKVDTYRETLAKMNLGEKTW